MLLNQHHLKLSWRKLLGINLLLALTYVLSCHAGFHSSPLWPPSGLALAMVLVFGIPQVLPGIVLGIGLIALEGASPLVTVIGLIISGLLECIMAAMLLRSVGKGSFKFKGPTDIILFIMIAVLMSPFVASTVAVTFIFIGGMIELDQIPKMWITFFVGNSLGILVFTPLTISFFSKKIRKINIPEALLLAGLLCIIGYWSFEAQGERRFLLLPLITWTALRFSFRGVSLATMLLGFIALRKSDFLWGVVNPGLSQTDLLWIQCLTAGAAIVGYFLATIVEVQEDALMEVSLNLQNKKIAEEALAILDQAINKSPIGFALIDKDYKYIRVNETLAKFNGYPLEYHLGKTVKEIIPDKAELIEQMIDEVFATGKSFMNNYFHGAMLNRPYPVSGQVSYYPVKHPATNKIFGVGITIQDMTEQLSVQSLLQEKQDFLTFAQEAGKIGSFEWDIANHRIVWTSELENIYGLNEGEFGGFYGSWLQWIHPEDVQMAIDVINQVIAGECELNLQFRIITKDKDIKWILARGKMIKNRNNEDYKFIGINIDLTEQKSIEHKLRLTEANLLHALSVRDEFVAIASHELKTPLTSLKLQTQIFQRSIERNDPKVYTPEKIQNLIGKNSSHIDRLTRLVDDMLDISRIRTGKLTVKKESCELSSMLLDILARTRNQFEASGSGQPIIEHIETVNGVWDPLRIEQVMTNIITNAIRYGQGKPIKISLINHQECVRLSVTDHGLGIAKSDHQKIFQRYERGLLAREVSGLGLGLFITQQIVLAHDGLIWLESEVGRGTTFYVDLPRSFMSDFLSPEIREQELSLIEN